MIIPPIEFYTSGTFKVASNSTIVTTNKSAPDATLFFTGGPGQTVDLRSNSEFYGSIYAPDADVIVNSNFEVFGAVVADSITLDSNCKIHYDEALRNDPTLGDPRYVAGGWSRAPFRVQAFLVDRRDPFMLLGVAPAALPTPEAAHVP